MRYRVYDHQMGKLKDVNPTNTEDFLFKYRYALREGMIRTAIQLLINSRQYPLYLTLGLCEINKVEQKNATESIEHLNYALENYVKDSNY